MSDFNLPASLTLDSTSPIFNPMSLEVLDPVSSEIPDSVSSILDLSEENLHESYLENDPIDNVLDDGTHICEICSNIPDIKNFSQWGLGTSLSTISCHFESKHPSLYKDFKQKNVKVTHSTY
ncbi:14121_t:CDS:2 [Cetraspora pellucida]|uniref:14121_t:CDS:1 n=1 Tax=Cetraspora pellucida TaxID=1433469 RepID=A0ACA9MZC4_9GLOM|nr:14121_t:CDS:2 [Cetraspora pellucida]